MKKGILASWTIWFGLSQVVYGLIGMLSGKIDGGTGSSLITTGIGTIVLRLKTYQPVI